MSYPTLDIYSEKIEYAERSIKRELRVDSNGENAVWFTEQRLTRCGCGRIEAGEIAREAYYNVTGKTVE